MSAGEKLSLPHAESMARGLARQLERVAGRVEIAGSIRRRRPTVGDLELLVEPLARPIGFFAECEPDVEAVREVVSTWGRLTKSGDRQMQAQLPMGIRVDVFLCHPPAEWGSLLAIRTGPAELSKWAVTLMVERGRRHRDGHVERAGGALLPTPTEADFFAAAGLPCLDPWERDSRAAFRPIGGPR